MKQGEVQRTTPLRPGSTPIWSGNFNNSKTAGLLEGLKSFNPALERYAEVEMQRAAKEAELTGELRGAEADLMADPASARESMPESISPAFGENFVVGYKNALGKRLSAESTSRLLSDYTQNKKAEGFDSEKFLRERIAEDLSGVNDPVVRMSMAQGHAEASRMIREDNRKTVLANIEQNAIGSVTTSMNVWLRGDMTPEALYNAYQSEIVPLGKDTKMLGRPEMAKMFVSHVSKLSEAAGGAPEYFEALDKFRDPSTGMTIADTDPELGLHIEKAKKQALGQRDKAVEGAMQGEYGKRLIAMEDDVTSGRRLYSPQELADITGPKGLFKTDNEMVAFWNKQLKHAKELGDKTVNIELASTGRIWAIKTEKEKQAALDTILSPFMGFLIQNSNSKDPAVQQQLGEVQKQFINAHLASGGDTVLNSLKARFDGVAGTAPEKEPPESFLAIASMYKMLPFGLRHKYADGDSSKIMERFIRETDGGVDEKSAYHNAYQTVSPAAKEAATRYASSPEFRKQMDDQVKAAVIDWTDRATIRLKNLNPLASYSPKNTEAVGVEVSHATRQWLTENSTFLGNKKAIEEFAEDYTKRNFVFDKETQNYVQVPPGTGLSEETQKAIELYSKEMEEKYPGDDTYLVFNGKDGYGLVSHRVGTTLERGSFGDIQANFNSKTKMSVEDGVAYGEVQKKIKEGNISLTEVISIQTLLAKAGANNWKGADKLQEQLITALDKSFKEEIGKLVKVGTPPGSTTLASRRGSVNDIKAQQGLHDSYMFLGEFDKALSTAGEGTALVAYDDPARGAGKNIGMGYNLNANAKTLKEDFRRAGIPTDDGSIQAIKDGKMQITQRQAASLMDASYPRYRDIAEKGVESISKGLWKRLSAPMKAVITDVAYQVGDIKQFKQSVMALETKDEQEFHKLFQVTYVNQKGERVPDTRRNQLRMNMLNGTGFYKSVLLAEQRKPADKLAALSGIVNGAN